MPNGPNWGWSRYPHDAGNTIVSLFEELKRRNVFRVAAAYLITGWVLLQVADLVLQNIHAPDWVIQVFMLALGIGFPVALIFAWAYELTPEGLKKEKDVDRNKSITPQTGRKLDLHAGTGRGYGVGQGVRVRCISTKRTG